MQITAEVERIAAIEPSAFVTAFERADRPVVIEGAMRNCRAAQIWNPDWLAQNFGHINIAYKFSSCHQHPDFHRATIAEMFARKQSSFGEFLQAITIGPREQRARQLFTGDEQFLLQRREGRTTVFEPFEPLLRDVPLPSLIPEDRLYTVWGWFSGQGVRSWLHYDNNGCHNLNAQITGRKECLLFPPGELSRLFPFLLAGGNPAYNCSQIDVESPDLEAFAAFKDAKCQSARLEAGDLLFIPAWWFHTFLHTGEFNSNVNFWWKPERSVLNAVATRQSLLDLVGLAGIDVKDAKFAELLKRLDQVAINRKDQ